MKITLGLIRFMMTIKTSIVELMLRSPSALQKQISDAVSIIGKYDFPKKWPQLIDEMVHKFVTGVYNVINGVLQTAVLIHCLNVPNSNLNRYGKRSNWF